MGFGNNLKLTIEEMQNLAKSKGGECLSDDYVNANIKLKWKCKEGHEWDATPTNIKHKNHWCPICSIGVSERICRKFFEDIFHDTFPKRKYDWIISPKGERLELDGYNKKLKLAFEYNGIQHYNLCGFHKEHNTLGYLQQCDKIKRDRCKEKGIDLIEVPYTVKYEDMEKFILNKTKSKTPFRKINYKEWDIYSPEKLKDMQKLAEIKEGICLSKNYINDGTKLKWRCKKSHEWDAIPNSIKQGHWCPICSKRIIIGALKELKEIAKDKNGECLSTKYLGTFIKLKWKCKEGHEWMAAPNHIKSGNWCRLCYNVKAKKFWKNQFGSSHINNNILIKRRLINNNGI